MRKDENNIFNILSDKYNIDRRVVELICRYPFIFTSKVIRDNEDERPIMLAKFGKIRLKRTAIGKKLALATEVERKKQARIELNKLKREYGKGN